MKATMVRISPSILSADFANMERAVKAIESAGADSIHCDIMDGSFVSPITFGAQMVGAIKKYTSLPLEVHLMIQNPQNHIHSFYEAGAASITVHAENCPNLRETLYDIQKLGIRAGVALNPPTSESEIMDIEADEVLVMSVNPGYGGQSFIDRSLDKIYNLKQNFIFKGKNTLIAVDGGINETTAALCIENGADILVAGNYVFSSNNMRDAILILRGKG